MSADAYTIRFGWPDKALSPNALVHWSKKSAAAARAKNDAWKSALEAGAKKLDWPRVEAGWTFFPPDRHARDDDNLVSSVKAHRDGVAIAIGIDDSNWSMNAPIIAERVPGGRVELRIERAE